MAEDHSTQAQLDEVYRAAKEQPVDAVLPLLHEALTEGELSRHQVYAWAEDISAGIPPKA
jgi:hypothetical protein